MNAIGAIGPNGTPGREPPLVLDISRLLSRAREAVPTGIDRVELAWAEHLLAHERDRLTFAAIHPLGRSGLLPFRAVARFVERLSRAWSDGRPGEAAPTFGRSLLHRLVLSRPILTGRSAGASGPRAPDPASRPLYLLLSHQNLDRPALIADAVGRHRARLVAMVHDLIPLEFPEYCGPRQPERHRLRIQTVSRIAEAVIVPSDAVCRALAPHLAAAGRPAVPIHVVPNGVHLREVIDQAGDVTARDPRSMVPPYFVCLGTIEPRKNHALLLAVWRRLAAERGRAAPRLILIGRRGRECEHVRRLIDRTPGFEGLIEEHNALPDGEVIRLLRGSCALLYPSFAEGFGLPVAEALALGVPVVCSDIPPHREIAAGAATFLDPTDGPGWYNVVTALVRDRGSAQQLPVSAGQPSPHFGWPDSVAGALRLVSASVAASEPGVVKPAASRSRA